MLVSASLGLSTWLSVSTTACLALGLPLLRGAAAAWPRDKWTSTRRKSSGVQRWNGAACGSSEENLEVLGVGLDLKTKSRMQDDTREAAQAASGLEVRTSRRRRRAWWQPEAIVGHLYLCRSCCVVGALSCSHSSAPARCQLLRHGDRSLVRSQGRTSELRLIQVAEHHQLGHRVGSLRQSDASQTGHGVTVAEWLVGERGRTKCESKVRWQVRPFCKGI